MLARHRREASVAATIVALAVVLALVRPAFFASDNLLDLFLATMPILIVALGTTMVILTGNIDISVGSAFAICSVMAGVAAKTGLPMPLVAIVVCAVGALLGTINGVLVAYLRIPAIVVTLAMMVALRDGLRWITQGEWVQDLPAGFQWLGSSQAVYPFLAAAITAALAIGLWWTLGQLPAGRAIYATGSNQAAARLAGIHVELVTAGVFVV